jgi:hypothetical protein
MHLPKIRLIGIHSDARTVLNRRAAVRVALDAASCQQRDAYLWALAKNVSATQANGDNFALRGELACLGYGMYCARER